MNKVYNLQSQLNLEFEKRSQNGIINKILTYKHFLDIIENKFERDLSSVEKNCRKLIDNYILERVDSDKKQYQRFSYQLDSLTKEIEKEFELKNAQQPYYNALITEDLPALRSEIDNEIQLRSEIELKVQGQFVQQLDELKVLCAEEREDRETKEEELINVLKGVAGKVQETLQKTKTQRFFLTKNKR